MKTWLPAAMMACFLGFGALGAQQTVDSVPIRFEPNLGQADPAWAFVARAGGARILVGPTGVQMGTLTLHLASGEEAASLEALEPLPGRAHYLLGAGPERWVRDVPTFAAVIQRSLYPGIDVVYRGTARRLEMEFVLSPRADAGRIALDLGGAHQLAADGGASVSLDGGASTWVLSRPVVDGEPGSLRSSGGVMKIDAPESDRVEPRRIVISIEALRAQDGAPRPAIAAQAPRLGRDAQGNLRLLGRTDAGLVFVTTLDASGRTVLRTTYLDGFASDAPVVLAVAPSGETAIAGSNGGDAVLVRLDAGGRSILSRAVVGGSGEDAALAVALDGSGNTWIAGRTASMDLPVSARSAQGSLAGGTDAFLAALDPAGKLVYASYLGGGSDDEARAIALDRSGAVYVTGTSGSADFPQLGPLQENAGGARDAFVARIDPAKGSLGYSTLLGGAGDDAGLAVAVTDEGEALIAGTTRSDDFPVVGEAPAAPGAGTGARARVFLTRLDARGRSLLQSTTMGASAEGGAVALALDRRGAAWIAGSQGTDVFLARIDPTLHGEVPAAVHGQAPAAASGEVPMVSPRAALNELFTGESEETASGLVIDGNGDAWVAGLTSSAHLPEVLLPESTHGGDIFLARVGGGAAPLGVCPGTKNFTGAVSLDWGNAGNWSGGTLPAAADDVCISGFNVTVSTGGPNIASLRVENGSLTMSGVTLTIAGASEINGALTINNGTLTGAGNMTVSGLFTWIGGFLSGSGSFTANGAVTLSGAAGRSLARTLNTAGAVTMSGAGGIAVSSTTINNAGTWDCQGTGTINGTGSFINTGTLKKTVGTGTAVIALPFTSTGSVLVGAGTLVLDGGSTSSGSYDVAASATLQFGTLNHSVNMGTTFTGSGTVALAGGQLLTNMAVVLPAGITFSFANGTLNGGGSLTTNGTFSWTAGTLQGPGIVTCNGPLNISGPGAKSISSLIVNNNGTVTWTGSGNIGIGSGSSFNNAGTFDCQSDASIIAAGGAVSTFNNTGTLRKSAGTGTTTVAIPLNHSGSVFVQSGTLALSGNSPVTGSFDISAGRTLLLAAPGTTTLNTGTTFSGSGTISSGSNININTNEVVVPAPLTFEFTGGFILGGGTLTTGGPFNWSGGTMGNTGTTQCNGPLNVTGTAARGLGQRFLKTNAATTYTATGDLTVSSASTIFNAGTWDFQSNASILAGAGATTHFVNSGTFRRSTGAGTATVGPPFINSGTVDVQTGTLSAASYLQSAGITKLTGGTLASGASIAIQGGVLGGSGTVSGPVLVSGTGALAPGLSPGTLGLGGTYTQMATGAFNVELGGTIPGTQYDRATVAGAAALDGALNVSLIGGYVPAPGTSFTVLTYPSRSGTFVLSPGTGCLGWQASYGATALTITARTVPAEVTALTFTSKTQMSWADAPSYAGTTYDLLRGALSALPVGPGAGESCLASGISFTTVTDPVVPAAGTGFWYVVREKVAGCGTGTYGFATTGAERISTACP